MPTPITPGKVKHSCEKAADECVYKDGEQYPPYVSTGDLRLHSTFITQTLRMTPVSQETQLQSLS